ncbi:MAG: hypothetical protein PHU51_05695 [Candidatus Nanoarchaeia archaeon]|nr:hypothetical protein [Candidatus Nanoarchaeia archaeon]
MSEIPTEPSTTKESGNNTQSGILSLPDINFSINCNVKVNIDSETKALLMTALRLLDGQNQVINRSSSGQIINSDIQSNIFENLLDDEPLELSVNIPEEVIEPVVEKPFGTIVPANQIEWNYVPKYKEFSWRQNGDALILRYAHLTHDIDWKTVFHLLKFSGSKRTKEIEKVVGSKTCKKITAINIFCRSIDEGIIKVPDDHEKTLVDIFSQYQAEEDPDAAYKPMVTPYINTAPNPECGKVEGTLEG